MKSTQPTDYALPGVIIGHSPSVCLARETILQAGITPFAMSLARIFRSSRFVTPSMRCLSSLDGAVKVSVTNSGKNLQLLRPGSKEKSFHSLWLRHSCQCSECTYTSGQRTVHWSELPKDLKIKSATLLG